LSGRASATLLPHIWVEADRVNFDEVTDGFCYDLGLAYSFDRYWFTLGYRSVEIDGVESQETDGRFYENEVFGFYAEAGVGF